MFFLVLFLFFFGGEGGEGGEPGNVYYAISMLHAIPTKTETVKVRRSS